jgi:hypothetical protein
MIVLRTMPHLHDDEAVAKMGHPALVGAGFVVGRWMG